MKNYIYIYWLILSPFLFSQEIDTISNIPNNITAKKIIQNYINKIGGEKKISKVKSLKKEFKVEINNVPHVNISGEVIYKVPDLYYSVLTMDKIGQMQVTKYNGKECIMQRNNNNEIIEKEIKGKALEKKRQDFFPFPIAYNKQDNVSFKLIEIHKTKKNKLYKIAMGHETQQETFLFFDANNKLLVKKEIVDKKTTKTIEYKNHQEIEGIIFPFLELETTKLNNKIAQETITTITKIIINHEIPLDQFQ